MAINPIQNTAVEKGNIISAASDMLFFLENSINDKPIYHSANILNEISNFSNLYNYHSLDTLSGFLKDRLSDEFNIKRGEIIKGQNTFNWIDYCYKHASEIRWCRFLYKNSNYLDNIGCNPEEEDISSNLTYALSLDAFVYLSSSIYTSAVVEKNNLSETGWQKCGGGNSSQINFLSNDNLSSFVSVDENNFEVGTLIQASDINITILNYNSILDLDKKAKDLSCEFCDGKDTYNYFYDNDLNNDSNVSVKFVLFSNSNNFQYVYNVFNFTGNYTSLLENSKAILNENSWRRLSNKEYSGDGDVGQSNWDKHKLFSNFTFSLADLGIIGINVDDFIFNGWHIIKTSEDKTSLSDATSLFGSTDKTEHFYFEYNDKENFNSIKNTEIVVNLSQPNSRYWIIPDISVKVLKPIIKSLNGVEITDTKNLPESLYGELLSAVETLNNGKTRKTYKVFGYGQTNHVGVSFNDTNPPSSNDLKKDTQYYGITRKLLDVNGNKNYRDSNGMLRYDNSTNKFWKALSSNELSEYMRKTDYETIPLSAFITVIFGTNIWAQLGNITGDKILTLTTSIYKSNGTNNTKSINDKIKDDQDADPNKNMRSSLKTWLYNSDERLARYIKFTYSGDTGDVNADGEYFIGNAIFRSTKLIELSRL